jgi:hypothetical protein
MAAPRATVRLLRHHMRQGLMPGLLVSAAAFGFQVLVARLYVAMGSGGEAHLLGRQIPAALRQFLGVDRLPLNTLSGFLSVAWQHPFLLAALLAVPIALTSALLAGEVEHRTMSLILTRRVGRVTLVLSAAMATAVWCGVAAGAGAIGSLAGAQLMGLSAQVKTSTLFALALNLFMLMLAVGGMSLLFSAASSERTDAVGWTVTLTLLMYVAHFAAQVWPAAEPWGEISLFHYYTPSQYFLGTQDPAHNLTVLAVSALVTTALAAAVCRLRDFHV